VVQGQGRHVLRGRKERVRERERERERERIADFHVCSATFLNAGTRVSWWKVIFPVPTGEPCENCIHCLTEMGIGVKMNSIVR